MTDETTTPAPAPSDPVPAGGGASISPAPALYDAGTPMPVLTDDQVEAVKDQIGLDDADAAAGYRSIIDQGEELAPDDPNSAVCASDHDHESHMGDPADDDLGVAAAGAELGAGGGH